MKTECQRAFLTIVRLGIGSEACAGDYSGFDSIDWDALYALACEQGLAAIVLDGLDMLPISSYMMPVSMKKLWIGKVIQGHEGRYKSYCRTISEMAAFYNGHGFKMMVLKGYACGLEWPKPEHRPYGDIDIWLFGRQKEADSVLAKEKGIRIDLSHHHHTVYYWGNYMVENHYDFVNVYGHKSSREMDSVLKQLGEDDSNSVEVLGEKIYLPSPNLHALFLLRHMISHFTSTRLVLRQILDWGFFIKAHTEELDWKWIVGELDRFHMKDFFNLLNAICVSSLGFDPGIFPFVLSDSPLSSRILNDTLTPEFSLEEPHGVFARLAFKYKRWRANEWKRQLCYAESRTGAFWRGVFKHLLKPASI